MSADNGIYILETNDGFHVAELAAIENYMYDSESLDDTDNLDVQIRNAREMWANSPFFINEQQAWQYAYERAEQCQILEYGVSKIHIERDFYEDKHQAPEPHQLLIQVQTMNQFIVRWCPSDTERQTMKTDLRRVCKAYLKTRINQYLNKL